jgi:hypothetical protein
MLHVSDKPTQMDLFEQISKDVHVVVRKKAGHHSYSAIDSLVFASADTKEVVKIIERDNLTSLDGYCVMTFDGKEFKCSCAEFELHRVFNI